MASTDWVEKELDSNFARASKLGRRLARTEPRAAKATYLARKEALHIELTNGATVQIPVHLVPHLQDVAPRDIRSVEVLGRGGGLRWERIDLDLGVPALVASVFGGSGWMSELGRAGGRSSSEAKTKAARKNGRKGGRPRGAVSGTSQRR